MTSSHHAPYALGDTCVIMAGTNGRDPTRDCRLQLACMKPKSLVIANKLYGGEFVPGPLTSPSELH
ncbi:hypothetical protein KSP39_PZI016634 [Platanthera zijinensis]|uniref:Uncharacterized protein n=1 Tax=Platanthera zijinensis TaxID=2320716 RepID=A0AAP0B6N4_9ASPA